MSLRSGTNGPFGELSTENGLVPFVPWEERNVILNMFLNQHRHFTLVIQSAKCRMDHGNDSKLLECVQMFPHLYNKREPLYRDKKAKKNAWDAISSLMNESADNCEQRFTILRNRYCTEKRTKRNIPSGSGASKCNWPLYEAMEFLDEFIVPRRTQTNLKIPTNVVEFPKEGSPVSWVALAEEDPLSISTTPDTPSTPHTPIETLTDSPMDCDLAQHETKTQSLRLNVLNKRQGKTRDRANLASTIQEAFNNLNKQMESSDDEETAFGNSVAAGMRKIKSKKKRYIVKSKIMTILAEAMSDSE